MARIVVALVTLWSAALRADEDVVTRSRQYYELGVHLYEAGRYEEALQSFRNGYQLAARPAFLINIGQCLRTLHRPREARAAFAKFLVDAPDKDPLRKGAQKIVAELDREIAALPPEPIATPLAAVTPTAVAAPNQAVAPAPPPPRRGIRKYWWLIPVTGVAVTALAVGLGVGLTTNSCPAGYICVNAR